MKENATQKLFCSALRNQLKSKGWSQKKLADFVGRKKSSVSLWVSGKMIPRLDDDDVMVKLAEFFGLDINDVKKLIASEKIGSYGNRQSDQMISIGSRKHFEQLLPEHATKFKNYVSSLCNRGAKISVEGAREKLRELGVDADNELVSQILEWLIPQMDVHTSKMDGLTRFRLDIDEGEFLETFQKYFRGEDWIQDSIRRVCRRLSKTFSKTADHAVPMKDVHEEIASVIETSRSFSSDEDQKALNNIVKPLVLGLERVKFLNRDPNGDLVKQLYQFSPEFLINRLFGISLCNDNLNFLFDGALHMPSGTGLTTLIKGRAGTGKTTLALHIASAIASGDNVALYLSAEEDLDAIVDRLSYIGYNRVVDPNDKSNFMLVKEGLREFYLRTTNFISVNETVDAVKQNLNQKRGTLIVVSIPNRSTFYAESSGILKNLSELLAKLKDLSIYSCYVIDSVDALLHEEKRRESETVFNFAKQPRHISLFTSELHNAPSSPSDAISLRDYLVDIVIRLGYRTREDTFSERVIEIEKCRRQSHIRGEHMFSTGSDEGVHIRPSVQSRLSIWRKRVRSGIPNPQVKWSVGELPELGSEGDIRQGSAVLLKGPPSAYKLPFGLSFLVSGLQNDSGVVLLISLREDEASIFRIIETHPQFSSVALLPSEKGSPRRFHDRFKVLYYPPNYYTPEDFLDRIRKSLQLLEKTHPQGISRVLFNNLSQLHQNSPMFAREKLFVAALIELFKKKGITSLFISVGDSSEKVVDNIFETIIFTNPLPASLQKSNQRSVEVDIRSGSFNSKRCSKILTRTKQGILTLKDTKHRKD